jgi:hypothetical protein
MGEWHEMALTVIKTRVEFPSTVPLPPPSQDLLLWKVDYYPGDRLGKKNTKLIGECLDRWVNENKRCGRNWPRKYGRPHGQTTVSCRRFSLNVMGIC